MCPRFQHMFHSHAHKHSARLEGRPQNQPKNGGSPLRSASISGMLDSMETPSAESACCVAPPSGECEVLGWKAEPSGVSQKRLFILRSRLLFTGCTGGDSLFPLMGSPNPPKYFPMCPRFQHMFHSHAHEHSAHLEGRPQGQPKNGGSPLRSSSIAGLESEKSFESLSRAENRFSCASDPAAGWGT